MSNRLIATNLSVGCTVCADSNGMLVGYTVSAFPFTGNAVINGNLTVTGNTNTSGCTTTLCLIETSAQRYKENIVPMKSQISKVLQLQPVEFDWISNKKHDIGFIADSVEKVYPNLVAKNSDGEIEGMSYTKLVSVIVKGMQEQQEQINSLKDEINSLYDEINKLKNK